MLWLKMVIDGNPLTGFRLAFHRCVDHSAHVPGPGLRIIISVPHDDRHTVVSAIRSALAEANVDWLGIGGEKWDVDLDRLKSAYPALSRADWLTGKRLTRPTFDVERGRDDESSPAYMIAVTKVVLVVMPEDLETPERLRQP
jgi:hypothetical protein